MLRFIAISILSLSLMACATMSPRMNSDLQQGKRYFEAGYYRRALNQLLPLACDGEPEAQYAVGYMYYYGYGPAQDTDIGVFWIKRSARQNYLPAIQALQIIDKQSQNKAFTSKQELY